MFGSDLVLLMVFLPMLLSKVGPMLGMKMFADGGMGKVLDLVHVGGLGLFVLGLLLKVLGL